MTTTNTLSPSVDFGPLTKQNNITEAIESFLSCQDVKSSSRGLYKKTLKVFFDWVVTTARTVSTLTLADLLEYKETLLSSGKSSLTVSAYVNSLRRFYSWTEATKLYPNIAKGLHAPKRKQQFRKQPLTVQQIGSLLRFEREQSRRDFAIINLLLRTGLRTIEVIRANVGDITYKGGQRVLLVQGKGRDEKDNFVILTEGAFAPIAEYLQKERPGAEASEPLFVSESHNNQGGRLTTRTVSKIAKEGLIGVGLNNKVFTAHSLRHTTAVNILRGGGTLEQVQYTLRHANPATTQIYTATLREEQRLNEGGEYILDRLFATI